MNEEEKSKPAYPDEITTAQDNATTTLPNRRPKKLLVTIGIFTLVAILGVAAALLLSKDDTEKQTEDTSQQIVEEVDTEKTQMEVAEGIYSEVAQEFELERSDLRFFWVYGDDRAAYAVENQGPGWIFAYKTEDMWKIASDAIQYFVTCDELNKVPEQYRPACVTGMGADTEYLYTDAVEYKDSTSILLASTNYSEADKHVLIGEETGAADEDKQNILSFENGSVQFKLPQNWTYETSDENCRGNVLSEAVCLEGAIVTPGQLLPTKYGNGTEYFKIYFSVFEYSGNNNPQQWLVEDFSSGSVSDEGTENTNPINGYDTYYRKEVNSVYEEVTYVLTGPGKKILVHARIFEPAVLDNGQQVGDFRRFEEDIAKAVESIVIMN